LINYGDTEKLTKKGIYFYRNLPEGQPINCAMDCNEGDGQIIYGELSPKIIQQMNYLMNCVYSKQLETMQEDEWQMANDKDIQEFFLQTKRFTHDLNESV